jgi:hypothetical protein
MNTTVTLAQTDADRQVGHLLFKNVYFHSFGLDFKAFADTFDEKFEDDLLLIRNSNGQLLGTASIIFPNADLFQSEYIFGATIRQNGANLPLHQSVEIGRLAKTPEAQGGLVTKAIMLAVSAYLLKKGLAGWVATVKPSLYRILKKTGLETVLFEEYAEQDAEKAAIVQGYKGDEIVTFWASAESTIASFQKMDSGDIDIQI